VLDIEMMSWHQPLYSLYIIHSLSSLLFTCKFTYLSLLFDHKDIIASSSKQKMGSFLYLIVVIFLFSSSVNACDRCLHRSKAAYFSSASALSCKHFNYFFLTICMSLFSCLVYVFLQLELVLMALWLRVSLPDISRQLYLLSTKTVLAVELAFKSDARTLSCVALKEPL